MAKVGRNDPCPCGSGRKYKNCCMRRDRLSESQRLGSGRSEKVLLSSLYEFALTSHFGSELDASFEVYWGGAFDPGGLDEIEHESALRWLDWFVHDCRVGEEKRHPIDIYIESASQELPEEYQDILRAMTKSTLGLYRVEAAAGQHLALRDLLRDQDTDADDAVLARTARRADLLIGRLYYMAQGQHFNPSTLLLPPDYEPGLVSYVRNAHQNHCATHGATDWDEFLRDYGYLFAAYLFSSRAEALRPLIGPGTPYHDPALARDRLREYTNRQRAARYTMQPDSDLPWPDETRTEAGIIVPGDPEQVAPSSAQQDRPSTVLIPGRDG